MQYRKFGKLDWYVSALGYGGMRLPPLNGDGTKIDLDTFCEMVHFAVDSGINYFDNAYVYYDGKSEEALGTALADGYREKVRIATKLPVIKVRKTDDFDRMLDEQMQRLQTGYIDFYLMHALNASHWEKIQRLKLLDEAEKALADGRIGHLGFSFHDNLRTFKTIVDGYDNWTFCQIQYNYMDIDYQAGMEGLKYAAARDLAVVIMEPLRGGSLANDFPAVHHLWENAATKRTPAEWSFQWLWSQPEVTVTLSGMSSMEVLKENIESANRSRVGLYDESDEETIVQARDALKGLSPIPCTGCEYCLPCPSGVNIPRNFIIYNGVRRYADINRSRFDYKMWLKEAFGGKADDCIQCDACIPKCPQQIPISTWMPIVDNVLAKGEPFVDSLE